MVEKRNRFESWRRKMATFKRADRLMVFWMLNQIEGVNRTDARLVMKVEDAFSLEEIVSLETTPEEYDEDMELEASDLELGWLKDQLDRLFKESKIPTRLSRLALAFDERLKTSMESVDDES